MGLLYCAGLLSGFELIEYFWGTLLRIAVLIPCLNEEAAIGAVVRDFTAALPNAAIYVYDNNSTDRTRQIAAAAGAQVCVEPRRGKGHVVHRMFADIESDIYVLVDGDDTYDAASAPGMIERLRAEKLDMVNGARVPTIQAAYRTGHRLGNKMLTGLVAWIFEQRFSDLLSGYRVFSRRFVKSFLTRASGFEIETALTVHALELQMPTAEVETPYKDRPAGSASKLRSFRDGVRILLTIFRLVEEERPLSFFGVLSLLCALASLGLAYPVFATYMETGLVPRLPTAVLSASLMVVASLFFVCGIILDMVSLGRREVKRVQYLAVSTSPLPQQHPVPEVQNCSQP